MGNTSSSSTTSTKSALKLKGLRKKPGGAKEKKEADGKEQSLQKQEVHALPGGGHSHVQRIKEPASLPSLQLPLQADQRTSQPTCSTASTPSKPTSTDTPATARGSANTSIFLASGSTSMGSASLDHGSSGEFGLMQKQPMQRSSECVPLPSPLEQQRAALQEGALSPSSKGTSGPLPTLREATCEHQAVQEPSSVLGASSGVEGNHSTDLPSGLVQQCHHQQQAQQQQQAASTSATAAAQGNTPQDAPARIAGTPRPSRKQRQVADLVSGPHELREEQIEELLESAAHMSARAGLDSKRALRRSYSAPGDCNQAKSVILSLIYGRYIPKDKQQASEQASPVSAQDAAFSQAFAPKTLNSAERKAPLRNASHLGLGSSTLAEQYALIWGSGGLSGKRRQSSRRPSSRRSSAGMLANGIPSFGSAEQQLQQLQRRQRRERNQPSQLARALVSSFRFDSRPKFASSNLPGVSGPTKKSRHASMLLAALPSLGDASAYLKDKGELSRDNSFCAAKSDAQARELSTLDMLARAKQRAQEEGGHGSSGQHTFMLPPLSSTSKGKSSSVFGSPGSLMESSSMAGSPGKTFLERSSGLPEEAGSKLAGGSGSGSMRRPRSERRRSVTFNSALSGKSGPINLQRTSSHSSGGSAFENGPIRGSGLSHSLSGRGSGMGLLSRAIMSSCSANPDQPMCRLVPGDQQTQRPGALRQHSLPSRTHFSSHAAHQASASSGNLRMGSPGARKYVSASGNIDVGSPGASKRAFGAEGGARGRSLEQPKTSL